MGRIEKQKRELIEESNKRMLGESIRVKPKGCYDNGKEIPCPKPLTVLEKLSEYKIKEEIEVLYGDVKTIEKKLSSINCDLIDKITTSFTNKLNESIRVKPEPCKPGECTPQEVMEHLSYLYGSISEVTKQAKSFIENQWVEKTEWCSEKTN